MLNRSSVLLAAGIVLLVMIGVGIAVDPNHLTLVVILFWVLVGVAVSLALFPPGALGWPERCLVSCAAALMLPGFGAIVGSLIPLDLSTAFWFGYLGLCGLMAGLIAWRRWPKASDVSRLRLKPVFGLQSLALVTAIGLVAAAVWISRLPVAPPPGARGYSLLWLEPDRAAGGASVGIQSAELEDTSYRLVVTQSGMLVRTVPDITLEPGERWVLRLELDEPGLLRADLYRLAEPDRLYRWVEQDLGN